MAGSDLKIKIVKKIEDIPSGDWYKVFPKTLENYNFFKTLDESNLSQFCLYYMLVFDKDTIIGLTSMFTMNFPLDIASDGKLTGITNFLKRIFPSILSPKALICGCPITRGRIGMSADPGKVIDAVYRGMDEFAAKEKIGIIAFKDFAQEYKGALDKLRDKGFARVDSLPTTDIDVNFSNFDEYLKSLSGISRSGLRRKFKEIDGSVKIDLEITNKLDPSMVDNIYALYLMTYGKQDLGMEKLTPEFFVNISKNMPGESKYFLWRVDGKLAAFALCLTSGDYFIDYYLGFDYSVAYKYHLYFVRFRDLMNWCIENKIKKYEMGQTAYEPKRRLGFNLVPLYFYLKHRNRIINPFFRFFSKYICPAEANRGA